MCVKYQQTLLKYYHVNSNQETLKKTERTVETTSHWPWLKPIVHTIHAWCLSSFFYGTHNINLTREGCAYRCPLKTRHLPSRHHLSVLQGGDFIHKKLLEANFPTSSVLTCDINVRTLKFKVKIDLLSWPSDGLSARLQPSIDQPDKLQ